VISSEILLLPVTKVPR